MDATCLLFCANFLHGLLKVLAPLQSTNGFCASAQSHEGSRIRAWLIAVHHEAAVSAVGTRKSDVAVGNTVQGLLTAL